MAELATLVEETVRDAAQPLSLNDLEARMGEESPGLRRTRTIVLALLDRGVLILDWNGKLRLRQSKGR
jgi:hypothetical protein